MRFNVATQSFETPVHMPNSIASGGNLAVGAADVWITDFNNDVVWRYHLSNGQFTSFPVADPGDVAVDVAGNAWFTQPGDVNAPGTSTIGRIDAVTGAVTTTPTTDGSITVAPRSITVAPDGQVWFTARFTPQAVGRLNVPNNSVTLFPVSTPGPRASPPHPMARCGSPRKPTATPQASPTPASSARARPSRAAARSRSPSPPTATPGTP
jgi:streptogramin lyase